MKNMKDGMAKTMIELGGALLIITAVVALVLGFVDSITKEKIIELKRAAIETAMTEVAGEGASFEETDKGSSEIIIAANTILRGGEQDGFCVQVAPNGFGGAITMIVGVSKENKVLGVKIVDMTETAGLGSNANDPEWLAQYVDQVGPLEVVKTTGGENKILALSGATVTSKGVTDGVQAALDFAAAQKS